jgi:hypothetical protein
MKVKQSMGRFAALATTIVIGAGIGLSAQAQTVLFDFGNSNSGSFRGVSVPAPDLNGNFWNSLQPGLFYAAPSLVDIDNNPTTLQFGFDGTPVGTDSFNGPAGATSFPKPTAAEIDATDIDAAALGLLGVKEGAIDYANSVGGGTSARFQLQGLDPSKTYNLTFFASHKFSTDDATVFSVFSDDTYATLVASGSLNVQTPGSPNLHNRDTVLTLSGLAPQTNNILYVQFIGSGGAEGYLNSLQVTAVPEPASLVLLGSCLIGVLVGVRRR